MINFLLGMVVGWVIMWTYRFYRLVGCEPIEISYFKGDVVVLKKEGKRYWVQDPFPFPVSR
jgi:hypothetical protein